jgi:hypothetical protein
VKCQEALDLRVWQLKPIQETCRNNTVTGSSVYPRSKGLSPSLRSLDSSPTLSRLHATVELQLQRALLLFVTRFDFHATTDKEFVPVVQAVGGSKRQFQ